MGARGNDNIAADVENLVGGSAADLLVGSGGPNILVAGNDADHVEGRGGNDTIYGDSGNDTLFGDEGNDTIYAGNGRTIYMVATGMTLMRRMARPKIACLAEPVPIADGVIGSMISQGFPAKITIMSSKSNPFIQSRH